MNILILDFDPADKNEVNGFMSAGHTVHVVRGGKIIAMSGKPTDANVAAPVGESRRRSPGSEAGCLPGEEDPLAGLNLGIVTTPLDLKHKPLTERHFSKTFPTKVDSCGIPEI